MSKWIPVIERLPEKAVPSEGLLKEPEYIATDNVKTAHLEPAVYYVCDRRACTICYPECTHTKEVAHAQNFENVDGDMFEKGLIQNFKLESSLVKEEPIKVFASTGVAQTLNKLLKGENNHD